jgi:hypothetical protein
MSVYKIHVQAVTVYLRMRLNVSISGVSQGERYTLKSVCVCMCAYSMCV